MAGIRQLDRAAGMVVGGDPVGRVLSERRGKRNGGEGVFVCPHTAPHSVFERATVRANWSEAQATVSSSNTCTSNSGLALCVLRAAPRGGGSGALAATGVKQQLASTV